MIAYMLAHLWPVSNQLMCFSLPTNVQPLQDCFDQTSRLSLSVQTLISTLSTFESEGGKMLSRSALSILASMVPSSQDIGAMLFSAAEDLDVESVKDIASCIAFHACIYTRQAVLFSPNLIMHDCQPLRSRVGASDCKG